MQTCICYTHLFPPRFAACVLERSNQRFDAQRRPVTTKNDMRRRGVVVGPMEVVAPHGLQVRFPVALHHHDLIMPSSKKGTAFSGGLRPKKHSYGEPQDGLALVTERFLKATGSPGDRCQPKPMSPAGVRDGVQVYFKSGRGCVAARGMTAFSRAPDGAFRDAMLLRRISSNVLHGE